MILRNLTIERCRFEGQQIAIRIMPEGGVVDGLCIRENRLEKLGSGILVKNTGSIRAEIVSNTIHGQIEAIDTWGSDLLIAGNRLTSDSDGATLAVFITSAGSLIRVRENQITAPKGQGVRIWGNAARVEMAENDVEAFTQVLQLYDKSESNPNERTATTRVVGNVFRSLSQEREIIAVQCGFKDDNPDSSDSTAIAQLLFTDNQVSSERALVGNLATVYLNAMDSIVTTNFVEESDTNDKAFSMIVEGIGDRADRTRRIIVAHNITRNAIRNVVNSGPVVTQPNVR